MLEYILICTLAVDVGILIGAGWHWYYGVGIYDPYGKEWRRKLKRDDETRAVLAKRKRRIDQLKPPQQPIVDEVGRLPPGVAEQMCRADLEFGFPSEITRSNHDGPIF